MSPLSSPLRFLQVSDLHLDSSLAGSKLRLPQGKRDRINRDMCNAAVRALQLAKSGNVDVVLIPGDLWDDESVGVQSATLLYDAIAAIAPIPVLIAPGNHDPYNAFSYHHPEYYRKKTGRAHPDNVTVFDSTNWQSLRIASIPDVVFHGSCFTENRSRTDRVLSRLTINEPNLINVALLHGSQDDAIAPDAHHETRLMTAPFSAAEILGSGCAYVALGHYHRYSTIQDGDGNIRAAYAGIPVARSLDEAGEHYVLLGEIDRNGVREETLQCVSLDVRRIARISVPIDPTITNGPAAQERVAGVLRSSGITVDDIVYAELTGRTLADIDEFDFDPAWCDAQCFHMVIDQLNLEPEHDLEALLADETASKRIEGRFAQRMHEMLAEAKVDSENARLLRAALNIGLDALQGREVKPRHVY